MNHDPLVSTMAEIARKWIYEKTGLVVPAVIITDEDPEPNREQSITMGTYNKRKVKICLYKAIFSFCITKTQFTSIICGIMDIPPITDPKQLERYRTFYNTRKFLGLVSVIIHEYGHYIHDMYFDYCEFDLPTGESRTPKKAEKNYKENFAIAFEEYVMESIPHETVRYQRMENIVKSLKRFNF